MPIEHNMFINTCNLAEIIVVNNLLNSHGVGLDNSKKQSHSIMNDVADSM